MKDEKIYYWECCNQKHPAESLLDAQAQLEQHEKEVHKSKQIGSFGWHTQGNK